MQYNIFKNTLKNKIFKPKMSDFCQKCAEILMHKGSLDRPEKTSGGYVEGFRGFLETLMA